MRAHDFPDLPDQPTFASRRDLKRAKVSDTVLQGWRDNGRRPLRAVYAKHPHDLDELEPAERLAAGSLWAGSGAVLTSSWALRLHGITVRREPALTRFLVPLSRRARTSARGFGTHRVRRMPPAVLRSGVRVVTLERALADAARFGDILAAELRRITISILQRRLSTPDRMGAELERNGIDGTSAVRDGVSAFRTGAWSDPEAILIEAVRACRDLPEMVANATLETTDGRWIGRPDGYFPDAGVVVQVHSRTFHSGEDEAGNDRWAATVEKDTVYTRHQLVVVPVTPETLDLRLDRFIQDLARIVGDRRGKAPLGVRMRDQ